MRRFLILPFRVFFRALPRKGYRSSWLIRRLYYYLVPRLKQPSRIVRVDGHRMALDRNDALALSGFGLFEEYESEVIADNVKKGDIALDLGANIGFHTLKLARLVGPTGRVYAVEPDPHNFSVLKRNVQMNGYDNVSLIPKAVSDVAGKAKLFLATENLGDHRTYDSGDGRESLEVETTTGDDILRREKKGVDFVKLDVQGYEGQAISGLLKTFARSSHVTLFCEFGPAALHRAGTPPVEFLESLYSRGFERIRYVDGWARSLRQLDRQHFVDLAYGAHATNVSFINETNLLCKKG